MFEVEVTDAERVELEDDLEAEIDADNGDRIRVYQLCSGCLDATTDIGADPPDEQSNVI